MRLLTSRNIRDHFINGPFSQIAQFLVRAILDRVLDEHHRRVEAKCIALPFRRIDEDGSRNPYRGNAAAFEIRDIMRTARGARTSIGQPFHR
jgi:hypothetical protein